MQLEALFRSAVDEIRARDLRFAVAGGFAAALYRREPRLTMDVDLAILTETGDVDTAVAIIESIGLKPGVAHQADLAGGPLFAIKRRNTTPCMVVGRPPGGADREGVDLLLPAIPWTVQAVIRAQSNEVNFGFGPVPALTLEDVILSKLYALTAAPLRAKDLDDLQSIFEAGHAPDIPYLAGQMQRLDISVPKAAVPFLSKSLVALARDVKRAQRSNG